jgi:hypothetical protein
MALLARNRYRLGIVAGLETNWQEQTANKQLQFPSGTDLQIEVGIYETSAAFYDISNVVSLTLEIKALDSGNAPAASASTAMGKTITGTPSATDGQIDATSIVVADWTARTAQHATFLFTDDESNLAAGDWWMVLSALLSDGARISLAWGKVKIIQDGTGPTVAPDPADPSYALSTDLDAYRTIARSVDHLRDFTGYTGIGSGRLSAVATEALAVNSALSLINTGVYQVWQLQAGTAATSVVAGIVRPDDYAATTNEKNWIRVL